MHRVYAHAAATFFLIFYLVTPVVAHPHMWIDLETRVILNDHDGLIAIQQTWLFDDFYSAAVIEEAALDPGGVEVGIQKDVNTLMTALEPYSYFTTVKHGNKTLSLTLVGDVEWKVIQKRVQMSFKTVIDERIDLNAQSLSYAIFDPTYYIEMVHFDDAIVKIEGKAASSCHSRIEQPNPSAEAVALSQSAALDSNPDDTIGRLFAETVYVNCR